MTLRAATEADLDALLELADAFYREGGWHTGRDELRANLRALLGSRTARIAVIEEHGALVAFAATTTSLALEQGLVAELGDLYVVPGQRQHGHGRTLLADSRDWARAAGCRALQLVVAPQGGDPEPLLRYYRRHGFLDEGRRLLITSLTPG